MATLKRARRKRTDPIYGYLLLESERYWSLAAQAALASLDGGNDHGTEVARGHIIRAGVWKEAANLVQKLETV